MWFSNSYATSSTTMTYTTPSMRIEQCYCCKAVTVWVPITQSGMACGPCTRFLSCPTWRYFEWLIQERDRQTRSHLMILDVVVNGVDRAR